MVAFNLVSLSSLRPPYTKISMGATMFKTKYFDRAFQRTFIIIIFLANLPDSSLSFKNPKTENSDWVKFCRGHHQKLIHTQRCTKGIQFPSDLQLNCFCAKGSWAIFSEDDCQDDSFLVVNGRANCFQVDKKVTRFLNLGAMDTGSIYLVGKGPSTGSNSKYILETMEPSNALEFVERSNPELKTTSPALEFLQFLVCQKQLAKLQETDSEPYFLIFKFPKVTLIMSRFNSLLCNSKFLKYRHLKLKPGTAYLNNEHSMSTPPHCKLNCQAHLTHEKKHSIAKRSISDKIMGPTPPPQPQDPTKDGLLNSKQNEATASLLRQNNAFLLFGIKENQNVSKNWVLLQKANKILKSACPNLDKTIQDSMVRMFRFLYARFKDGPYAPKEFLESEERLARVTKVLEQCSADARKIEFKFGPPGACAKDKKIVEAKIIERTILATENNSFSLPSKEAYSKSEQDVHIEAIWKMISFVHYYCSEYFYTSPFDHSALTQMLTGFFGEEIVYRWHNPEVSNKGFYAVFNTKNMLEQYAEGIDACVAIAKKIAVYPVWIERPSLPSPKKGNGKQRTKREIVRKGKSNICLKSLGQTGLELCSTE